MDVPRLGGIQLKINDRKTRVTRVPALISAAVLLSTAVFSGVGVVDAQSTSNLYIPAGVTALTNPNAAVTAINIAKLEYPESSTAILASGASSNLFDPVLASPLASALKAPILLTQSDSQIGAVTLKGLDRLGIKSVILVGADAANMATLAKQLPSGVTVKASYGNATPSDTAAALAGALKAATKVTAFSSVFVVSDSLSSLSDAIAAAPQAAASKSPILVAPTTGNTNLPANEAGYAQSASTSYLIGAAAVVNIPGNSQLVPIVGADRSWTALNVDSKFVPGASHIYITNAAIDMADAVTMAPLVAENQGAVLYFYSPSAPTPNGTASFLATTTDTSAVQWMTVVGPTSSISATDYTTLETDLPGLGKGVQSISITAPAATPIDSIVKLSATATAANGSAVTTPLTWSVSGPMADHAVIESTGADSAALMANAPGLYTVNASVGGFTASQNLPVTAAVYSNSGS